MVLVVIREVERKEKWTLRGICQNVATSPPEADWPPASPGGARIAIAPDQTRPHWITRKICQCQFAGAGVKLGPRGQRAKRLSLSCALLWLCRRPSSVQCWSNVGDVGPSLNRRWADWEKQHTSIQSGHTHFQWCHLGHLNVSPPRIDQDLSKTGAVGRCVQTDPVVLGSGLQDKLGVIAVRGVLIMMPHDFAFLDYSHQLLSPCWAINDRDSIVYKIYINIYIIPLSPMIKHGIIG